MGTCQQMQTQPVKQATRCVSEQQSLQLTRNLMRIAIFNITYIRGLFPEEYFVDKFVPALEMKIKKLLPLDNEARRLIDWMEKGVYDALHNKYLKTLLFSLCNAEETSLIEEYSFSFSYSTGSSEDVSMNIMRNGDARRAKTFATSTPDDVSPTQMKNAACKMVRTLVQLMRTLDHIPDERTILMKLFYYEDVTPPDYEPPFFRACSGDEKLIWSRAPVKLAVGDVDSKHFAISLKVKSILDPCDGDNEEMKDAGGPYLGCQDSETSDSESDQHSDINPKLCTQEVEHAHGKDVQDAQGDNGACTMEEDVNGLLEENPNICTQLVPMVQADGSFDQVENWVLSRETKEFNTSDILQNFPDISVMLVEEILDRLIQANVIFTTGKDRYQAKGRREAPRMNASSIAEYTPCVKDSRGALINDAQAAKTYVREEGADSLYLQALSHVLQMDYVTTTHLHCKLGRPPFATIRKLMDRMANEGYIEEVSSNRRLGRRVLHTKESEAKLQQVRQSLNIETQVLRALQDCSIARAVEQEAAIPGEHDESIKAEKEAAINAVSAAGVTLPTNMSYSGLKRPSSPDRVGTHALSRESSPEFHRQAVRKSAYGDEGKTTADSRNTCTMAECVVRKASKVKDPIFQQAKRFRSDPEATCQQSP